jgi:hypothetical protein
MTFRPANGLEGIENKDVVYVSLKLRRIVLFTKSDEN